MFKCSLYIKLVKWKTDEVFVCLGKFYLNKMRYGTIM